MPSADLNRTPRPTADSAGHLPLALLRQYAAGTLTPAEQHRVEAHTLGCARCADILEGLSATDAATTDHAVTQLRQRLHARVAAEAEPETPTAWPWARMAAVLLLLILSTVAFFWLRPQQKNTTSRPVAAVVRPAPSVAEAIEPATAAAPAPMAAPTPTPAPPVVAAAPTRTRRAARQPRPTVAAAIARATPVAVDSVSTVDLVLAAASFSDSLPAMHAPAVAVASARKRAPGAAKGRYAMADFMAPAAASAPVGQRMVRGRVTEQPSGQPLPGVTVVVPGTNRATSTAADGTFALPVPAATNKLSFSSIGYIHQEQAISPDSTAAPLTLAMAPDTKSLNEVVVVRREKAPAPVSVAPLPTGGYRAWNQYLRDSLQYPEKALEQRKEGTVHLRFMVGTNGQVQDIEVVRRVSDEIDEEAIRLLKAGPAWHAGVQNGRRTAQKVQVSIPFRLEDQR